MVKLHGDSSLSSAQVFRWQKELKKGHGMVQKELLPPRQTDIARNWIFHYDNVPCHIALSILQQPPYSPDMSPFDFFPRTKSMAKGTQFESIEDIQMAVNRFIADHGN
ncbi:uncharacterized protein LOC110118799 [Ceratitis capitata]|uniref:uncharacterized protein LOC110118799 n=1 Tax=Ceratitis capitata TaxID=7213 RepID=UPI000A10AB0E|nr:uncharacterized protein LOC110118799 [Ceratitis capitata]